MVREREYRIQNQNQECGIGALAMGTGRMFVLGNRLEGIAIARLKTALTKACGKVSRRDDAIVAWQEVPRTKSPQKSRPVGSV